MKMKFLFFATFTILLILIFSNSNFVYPQKITELKEKKKAIEKEIESISDLISKTDKESTTSLTNIRLTKKRIDLKNKLIKQLDIESNDLNIQINIRKNRIDSLKQKINKLKDEYSQIIIYSQKNENNSNFLLQIFASTSFNQAYKRIKFYQQVLNYKKEVVDKYKYNISKISEENKQLNESMSNLNKKQAEKESEVKDLKFEEKEYQTKIEKLNFKKRQLLADLEEQKKISKKINDEIKKLIEEEARRVAENFKKTTSNNLISLNNNFKENIGKFTLPVNKGIVTSTFGESFHPILKEVKIKNNGIDITVSSKSDVYVIFKGEVRKIFKVPGSGLAIIIRHGNFLSVYSNLTTINVSVGQDVNSYQKIGEINLQKGEETAILHFELWNENKPEDPLKWIKN